MFLMRSDRIDTGQCARVMNAAHAVGIHLGVAEVEVDGFGVANM